MTRQLFGLALGLCLVALTACMKSGSSVRPPDTSQRDGFESGLNGGGSSDPIQDLAKTIGSLDGANEAQDSALSSAGDALRDYLSTYGGLDPGVKAADVRQLLSALAADRAALKQAADQLAAAGLSGLAEAIYDLLRKADVFRFFNTATGKHYHSTGAPEAGPWKLEGVAFRIYREAIPECRIPIYRCYLPSGDDHYFALDDKCGGGNLQAKIGFLCQQGTPKAFRPVMRLYKEGDHLQTIFQEEIDRLTALGWTVEGGLGWSTF